MSFTWGAVIGTASFIPYFYSVFFITVLIHRTGRDFERFVAFVISGTQADILSHSRRCSIKYGKDWQRYCSTVKYKFIPGIY